MKISEYIKLFFLFFLGGVVLYQEAQINKQLKQLSEYPPITMADIEPEYLIPAPKEQVEAIVTKYYDETTNKPHTVKIQPIKSKSIPVNIKSSEIIDQIAVYIKKKEGFRAHAYKDNTQYSIGYGTKATSKEEIITVQEAEQRLYKHITTVIIPSFDGITFQSVEQVYSAIDFSYNLGHNTFKQKIVREDGIIDCRKMMAYNKMRDKNGNLIYNEGLAQRRLENFLACSSYEIIEE